MDLFFSIYFLLEITTGAQVITKGACGSTRFFRFGRTRFDPRKKLPRNGNYLQNKCYGYAFLIRRYPISGFFPQSAILGLRFPSGGSVHAHLPLPRVRRDWFLSAVSSS